VKDSLSLGKYQARWRDYRGQDVCSFSPQRLAEELEDANSLLSTFLTETSSGWRALWTPEQMALLEEGQKRLPEALNVLEHTHRLIAPCPFERAWGFEELITQGQKLSGQTRVRLAQAPQLLNMAKRRRELEAWKKEQDEQRQANREQWCKSDSTLKPYYAAEDEDGQRVFVFCDGAEVTVPPNAAAKVTAAPVSRGQPNKAYLDAAARFPEEELLRAPSLPRPPADE